MKLKLPMVWLIAGGLLLAGTISRGQALGQQPLQPDEATLAVATVQQIDPAWPWPPLDLRPATAYAIPTAAAFGLAGVTAAAARAAPALAGVLLLSLPFLLASRIGWPKAILISGGLLVSSSLWMVARTVSPESMALLGFGFLLVGAISRPGRPILAGIGVGLGLAAGAGFWHGVAGLALAWPIARLLSSQRRQELAALAARFGALWGPAFALSAAVTALALGTRFGTRLGDLGALFSGPGEWLGGLAANGLPFFTKLLLIPAYEPLLLVAGLTGVVLVLQEHSFAGRAVTAWLVGAFALYLVFPQTSGNGFAWVALPLAALAAIAVEQLMERMLSTSQARAAWLLAGALTTLVVFAGFSLEASIQGFGLASLDRSLQLVYGAAAIGFVVALVVLFGLAWSWREAGLGLGLALLACLLAANVSAGWRLTRNPEQTAGRELWRQRSVTANAVVLERSVASIANAHIGRAGGLPVRLAGGGYPPYLIWLLRDQVQAGSAATDQPPPVILAPETLDFGLPADYLGQSLALVENWGWLGPAPSDLLGWWLDRRGETWAERWVLFVRDDIAGIAEPLPLGAE